MKKLLVILFLLCNISILPQSSDITQTDDEINKLIFSGEWLEAKSIIEQQIRMNPDHPKYYFMKAYMYYLSRYFADTGMTRDSTINTVHYYARTAIKKAELMEQTNEIKFYTGCAYGYLARAHGMRQEWWSAYWAASDCENYLEAVIKEDPEIYDAYFELGVINYYPSVAVTGFTSFLAWLGGMSGDRTLGLKYLHDVAENGHLFKAEALVALGIIYNGFENDLPASREYYSRLLEMHPENNLSAIQMQRIDFTLLIDEKGVEYFTQNFETLKDEYNVDDPTDLNILGYYLINSQRLDDALAIFLFNIELYPAVANCYDSLAECYLNRNENENAIKYYKIAYEKLPADTTADEEFKEFLKTNIQDRLEELGSKINS
ncbi:MAG: tetratricopeptide repeat protein [Ignavibacteria bacterium]|nr:tetratricopeptide repeat protein [Ignavibacteria bacterium]MBT8381894.1 tetratricopeptide repeat protein [Ignavibacteria bacterium]MBT8391072.1 tetratricopeptide repeat protein [Ignavibacteria bacterium]NNJ54453.1 tetratricopeptide repeat protein [Ignavibacteriaceae bacterium]NNL21858.1 tetratricopeptide repeat protein [Ignavibacteriaceae bacterium]